MFTAALERLLSAEMRSRRCLVGPQRDDLDLRLDRRSAASFASAGEQRRVAFVLVVAAVALAIDAGGAPTVMLIDDVEAEFDDQRLDCILAYTAGATQSLVATSKREIAKRFAELGKVFEIANGRISEA